MKKFIYSLLNNNYQRIRRKIYRILSTNSNIEGQPIITQPALFIGLGSFKFGTNSQIGYFPSPYYYSGYAHFEARTKNSHITIGSNVYINNNFVCISEESIIIGNNVLIGTNVEIIDTDAHNIHPEHRNDGIQKKIKIIISDNVWIGSNVKILKGVNIGKNSVIANSSVVTNSVPENSVVAGIPAKVIKDKIDE